MNGRRLQLMLAALAQSRAELSEAFARFAAWKGDSAAEQNDLNEAREFHTLAETHRASADGNRMVRSRRRMPEQA